MIPVNQENLAKSPATSTPVSESAATPSIETPEQRAHAASTDDKPEPTVPVPEVKGDPEMAPVFLRQLLPVFTHVYQAAMLQSVK